MLTFYLLVSAFISLYMTTYFWRHERMKKYSFWQKAPVAIVNFIVFFFAWPGVVLIGVVNTFNQLDNKANK